MPQINDTTGNIKTSFVVRVDAKAEGFERISMPRGEDVPEGGLMVKDAQGRGVNPVVDPGSGDVETTMVYINFSNPNAPQTSDRQSINEVGGATFAVDLSSGGYAGINGSGLRIGLPLTEQFFVAADIAAIRAEGSGAILNLGIEATVGAARFGAMKLGLAPAKTLPAVSATRGNMAFGIVDQIEAGGTAGEIIWFTFDSLGYHTGL
jgi:hypothetical protein